MDGGKPTEAAAAGTLLNERDLLDSGKDRDELCGKCADMLSVSVWDDGRETGSRDESSLFLGIDL